MNSRTPHVEIERKFLVQHVPIDLTSCTQVPMRQGYLVIDDARRLTVRIRQEGPNFRLTIKRGIGAVRTEVELPLDGGQFEALWPSVEARLEKVRHLYQSGDAEIEIDIFDGELAPLVVAEVEFNSEEEAACFSAPDWFGRDVTDDPRYLNQNLARFGIPQDGDG